MATTYLKVTELSNMFGGHEEWAKQVAGTVGNGLHYAEVDDDWVEELIDEQAMRPYEGTLRFYSFSGMSIYDADKLEQEQYQVWERISDGTLWVYSDPVQRRGNLLAA